MPQDTATTFYMFSALAAVAAVLLLRIVEASIGFRIGPQFVSRRESGLKKEVSELRDKVAFLEREYREAVERELNAHREIDALRHQIDELKARMVTTEDRWRLERKALLVALASDVAGWMDLAATRAQPIGLTVTRLNGVTKERLKRFIDRGRMYNRPVELLHIGAHAGPDGIKFDDEMADANWLSEHLAGVKVLLIAGCSADALGDWLGVVPYVVTMAEDVADDDAAKFAQAFWAEIGAGRDPGLALDAALMRAPAGMEEYVERHW